MSDFISGTFLQIQLSGRICDVSRFSMSNKTCIYGERERKKNKPLTPVYIDMNVCIILYIYRICVCMHGSVVYLCADVYLYVECH